MSVAISTFLWLDQNKQKAKLLRELNFQNKPRPKKNRRVSDIYRQEVRWQDCSGHKRIYCPSLFCMWTKKILEKTRILQRVRPKTMQSNRMGAWPSKSNQWHPLSPDLHPDKKAVFPLLVCRPLCIIWRFDFELDVMTKWDIWVVILREERDYFICG